MRGPKHQRICAGLIDDSSNPFLVANYDGDLRPTPQGCHPFGEGHIRHLGDRQPARFEADIDVVVGLDNPCSLDPQRVRRLLLEGVVHEHVIPRPRRSQTNARELAMFRKPIGVGTISTSDGRVHDPSEDLDKA